MEEGKGRKGRGEIFATITTEERNVGMKER